MLSCDSLVNFEVASHLLQSTDEKNECVVGEMTMALETRAAGSEVSGSGRCIVPQSTLNDRR
jgi:hypothetical protein